MTKNGSNDYIGQAEGEFKMRINNHKMYFENRKYETKTELVKYVWELKDIKVFH